MRKLDASQYVFSLKIEGVHIREFRGVGVETFHETHIQDVSNDFQNREEDTIIVGSFGGNLAKRLPDEIAEGVADLEQSGLL